MAVKMNRNGKRGKVVEKVEMKYETQTKESQVCAKRERTERRK